MRRAPIGAPTIVPSPPRRLVPPTMAAVIAPMSPPFADRRLSRVHAACIENASQGREHSGQAEDDELDPPHANPDERRSFTVAADRVNVTSKAGARENPEKNEACADEGKHRRRDAEDGSLAEDPELRAKRPDRVASGDDEVQAGKHLARRKGHDKWVQPTPGDQRPINQSEPKPEQGGQERHKIGMDSELRQHQTADNGRESRRRSDGKIDPANQQNESCPRATRPTKDACRATTVRLYCERKFGEAIDSAAARSRRATRIPLASHFRNRLKEQGPRAGR